MMAQLSCFDWSVGAGFVTIIIIKYIYIVQVCWKKTLEMR